MIRFNLKKYREAKGFSQKKLADMIGVSQSTVAMWEVGRNNPEYAKIEKLAEALDVGVSDLMGIETRPPKEYRRVPVLGEIPAGIPIEAIEDVLDWEDLDEKDYPPWYEFVGLQIKGDSMSPDYQNKDILIVRLQDTADTGDDVIAFVNGDDATFKRLTLRDDGIMLRPLNPAYDPMFFSNADIEELPVRIFGIAVEVRRKVGQ